MQALKLKDTSFSFFVRSLNSVVYAIKHRSCSRIVGAGKSELGISSLSAVVYLVTS